jgi:hypothetical protein
MRHRSQFVDLLNAARRDDPELNQVASQGVDQHCPLPNQNRGHCAQRPYGPRRFAGYPWFTAQWLAGAIALASRGGYAGSEGSR